MILTIDVGNSQIFAGLFDKGGSQEPVFRFRKTSKNQVSSDELGVFLRSVLRENSFDPAHLTQIAVCTVVPGFLHSIRNCCLKYFKIEPFILKTGVRTGLNIKYRNPVEVGSDRIANAIAATTLYPDDNKIVIDFGTATTFCAIGADKNYLGGLILPGFNLSMRALESNTSKLPSVDIIKPEELVGRSTVESIQSGLYYSNLAAVREISKNIRANYFLESEKTVILGTGGFARLFEDEGVFDQIHPDLVLQGLYFALKMNH